MSRRRVDLVAPPMSGHLHPILGMAQRIARDADVRVISTAAAQPEIAAAGLVGCALLTGADEAIDAIVNPPHSVGSHPLRLHRQFCENLRLLERFRSELHARWQTDAPYLAIVDFTLPVAGSLAETMGIRWWTSMPSPCAMESPDGPPAYLGGWTPWPGPIGAMRDAVGRQAIRLFKRVVHRWHRDTLCRLGFPSVYRADGYEAIYSSERVLALGLEALEFPRQMSPAVEYVGPVLYTPPGAASAPEFVEGRPHVLVTVGTHLPWRRDAVARAVEQAAAALPHLEFHLSDGHRQSARSERHGNVLRVGYVSYARDLSRYDLVVHHGGAGVTYHTLAAGLPSVVVPSDFDQFDFAARIEHAGAGMWVRDLDDLPRAIPKVLAHVEIRERAKTLQAILKRTRADARIADWIISN